MRSVLCYQCSNWCVLKRVCLIWQPVKPLIKRFLDTGNATATKAAARSSKWVCVRACVRAYTSLQNARCGLAATAMTSGAQTLVRGYPSGHRPAKLSSEVPA